MSKQIFVIVCQYLSVSEGFVGRFVIFKNAHWLATPNVEVS